MSLIRSTKLRTDATEIMDDFSISGKILRNTLNTLAHINKWLGGNKVTLNGLKKVINKKVKLEKRKYLSVRPPFSVACDRGIQIPLRGKRQTGYLPQALGGHADEADLP